MSPHVVRRAARTGLSVLLLVVLMFVGSLGLWVGVPLLWLWIGSRVQGSTQSLGAAIGVMGAGVIVSVAMFVPLLAWLSHKHAQVREARGIEGRSGALESILIVSATIAIVGFGIWFFFFAGADPFPFHSQS